MHGSTFLNRGRKIWLGEVTTDKGRLVFLQRSRNLRAVGRWLSKDAILTTDFTRTYAVILWERVPTRRAFLDNSEVELAVQHVPRRRVRFRCNIVRAEMAFGRRSHRFLLQGASPAWWAELFGRCGLLNRHRVLVGRLAAGGRASRPAFFLHGLKDKVARGLRGLSEMFEAETFYDLLYLRQSGLRPRHSPTSWIATRVCTAWWRPNNRPPTALWFRLVSCRWQTRSTIIHTPSFTA